MSERVLRGVSLVYAKYYLLLQIYPSASWIEKLNPAHKAAMQTSIEKSIYQKYDEIKAFPNMAGRINRRRIDRAL